ncbi:hypothetical protein CEXT_405131 [Caerostris extrusa]|uniref:Uncharacterized protein n=1 Tax=Caerostris extrusa TaxID=172846 RepID=A0AAV4MKD8_CAEEX|nr:hypothetical protein CEXT_405131 [Caerostris extrusa]
MFTPQITLGEDTSTDEGNVSLRTKPASNEIVRSPIPMPMKQAHKLSLFNWMVRWKYKYKNALWMRISTFNGNPTAIN